MPIARSLLLGASRSRWLREQITNRAFARRAVKRFMPGERLDAALEAARDLARQGLGTVVTQLGENLTSLAEADAVRDHYLGVFDVIQSSGLPTWPSVKPTQLGLDLSFDACLANLTALAVRADAADSMLWIDMEDSRYVDRTLELFRRLMTAQRRPVGVCLQAYLWRTPDDVRSLLPLKPAIRLVKGAYAEPPDVAFPARRNTDLAYERLARALLEAAARGGALPVFGTHDTALLSRITKHARDLGVRDGAWEIHMLYGIRAAEQRALASAGRRVRTLISYGEHWFPWYMRRLAERPANVWFVVRSVFA